MERLRTQQLVLIAVLALAVCLAVECWPDIAGFLGLVWTGCVPVLVGLAFAFVANIPMSDIERHLDKMDLGPKLQPLKRTISLTLTIIVFVLALIVLVALIVPQFAEAIMLLQVRIPEYIENFKELVGPDILDTANGLIASLTGTSAGQTGSGDPVEMLSNAGGLIGNLATTVIGFASSAVMVVMSALMSIALLAEKELFREFGLSVTTTYLGQQRTDKIVHVLSVFDRTFHGFLVKQFADAISLGLLVAAFMLIAGLPYASAVATLVGLSALIPLIGVYVGLALGALLVLASSPLAAIVFLVVAFILIQVEASFISPRITESALGIPGVWVLICITIFGAIWGILGILVGVPTFAALYHLLQEDIERRGLTADESAPLPTQA